MSRRRFSNACAMSASQAPICWRPRVHHAAVSRRASEAGLRGGYLTTRSQTSRVSGDAVAFVYLAPNDMAGRIRTGTDTFLFPGLLVLVLAAFAVARVLRQGRLRDNWTAFYLVIAVVATLMFIERPVEIWRYVHGLPGLSFIRIPARFVILTMLALAGLAGIGFDGLVVRASRHARMIAMLIVAALLLGEAACIRWLVCRSRRDTADRPVARLAAQAVRRGGSAGSASIRYGGARAPANAGDAACHGALAANHPRLQQPARPLHDRLYLEMADFPDPPSVDSLRELGVNFVVVHTDQYGAGGRASKKRSRTPRRSSSTHRGRRAGLFNPPP